MRAGTMAGPESNFWIVPRAPTRSFTCEPPTSMTRMCRAAELPERFLLARIGGFSPQALPACKRLGYGAHQTCSALTTAKGGGRMIRPHNLVVALMVLTLSAGWAAARAGETSKVLGSIDVGAGEHTGDLSTVNGSVRIGENAVVGSAHTVNGGIELASHASAAELKTV